MLGTVGVLQTLPSLALLVFMVPLLGLGAGPAIVALFLYSLLPIVRNTYTGLQDIPPPLNANRRWPWGYRRGLGSGVELPMASRSILAGIKTAAVINVGTATIGGLIGAGGYGEPILTGIRLNDVSLILQAQYRPPGWRCWSKGCSASRSGGWCRACAWQQVSGCPVWASSWPLDKRLFLSA